MNEDASALASTTELFATLLARNGPPPRWRRPATFATLIRFILEQQVSLASAQAAFAKLDAAIGEPAPAPFLDLDDPQLREIGFSRQKAGYVRGIADLILADELDLDWVVGSGDEGSAALLRIRGIGPWTVACFDLFVSGRRDVWPTGDRALYVSLSRNLGCEGVMSKQACDEMAAHWSPYRSTAAMMLWHDYLGGSGYELEPGAGFLDDTGMVSE
ncbi:MAG: DNA-3-methyladenine glycosylase 2 family protein [Actinomycetia bacterium]|nr:DNA-3-methyladenine glycosylase 2 family protein [Actinomycetes bacterium]